MQFQFACFKPFSNIRHGIFARKGGVSPAPFDSLNVGYGVGDKPESVSENRRRIADCMDGSQLIFIHQVHGTGIWHCPEKETPESGNPRTADAMVSSEKGTTLVVQVADCQPVLLYDPVGKVAAIIHSGWRGSIRNIVGRTIRVMAEDAGSRPEDIIAGIGPSLGPCCAEFVNYRTEIPGEFWTYRHRSVYFDFWAITKDQLVAAGLKEDNIETSGMCTKCNPEYFFSYRKDNRTGRFAAVIGLK